MASPPWDMGKRIRDLHGDDEEKAWPALRSASTRDAEERAQAAKYAGDVVRGYVELAKEEKRSLLLIFTDGSSHPEVTGGGGSAAIFTDGKDEVTALKVQLCIGATNVLSELEAIRLALKGCLEDVEVRTFLNKPSEYDEYRSPLIVVLSDCQQAVVTAKGGYFIATKSYWAAQKHFDLLKGKLRDRRWRLVLDWIPGHTGLWGNERADAVAKEAAVRSAMAMRPARRGEFLIPYNMIKYRIRVGARAVERRRFTECVNKAKALKEITGGQYPINIGPVLKKLGLPRRDEICFERLRTGCVVTNETAVYWCNRITSKKCERCGQRDGADHRMLECQAYNVARRELRKVVCGYKSTRPLTMKRMLDLSKISVETKMERISAVVNFLRKTKLDHLFYLQKELDTSLLG
jgi:ribonuclease HI